jgi:hypothetical protein
MATSQPPSPSPAGRPDQDDRPSIKVVMAASMLRRGHQPLEVANATGVPLALVELLTRHRTPSRPARAPGTHMAQRGDCLDARWACTGVRR